MSIHKWLFELVPFLKPCLHGYPDFLSLSRFGFVLTRNGFKFETRVNNIIINHNVPLKTDYNTKMVAFLNWANFVIS